MDTQRPHRLRISRRFWAGFLAAVLVVAGLAAATVLRLMHARLAEPVASPQVDLCVSHDMTLYLMREVLLGEPADGPEVGFLDALVLYERDGTLWMRSHHGEPREVRGMTAA